MAEKTTVKKDWTSYVLMSIIGVQVIVLAYLLWV